MHLGPVVHILALGLLGCSSLYREDPCGRVRSVTALGPVTGLPGDSNASLTVIDQDSNGRLPALDGFSWNFPVSPEGDSITAMHIHDRIPGNGNRIIYFIHDYDPGPGFSTEGSSDYSFNTPIETLFQLVLAGQASLDIHTASHPEGVARADLTSVQVEDWSGYYCS
jgi:hypothetical protein